MDLHLWLKKFHMFFFKIPRILINQSRPPRHGLEYFLWNMYFLSAIIYFSLRWSSWVFFETLEDRRVLLLIQRGVFFLKPDLFVVKHFSISAYSIHPAACLEIDGIPEAQKVCLKVKGGVVHSECLPNQMISDDLFKPKKMMRMIDDMFSLSTTTKNQQQNKINGT